MCSAAFEEAGLTQDQVREMFLGISPMAFMERFAASRRSESLVVHATYDLTFSRGVFAGGAEELRGARGGFCGEGAAVRALHDGRDAV